jgi:hypothetical protein
VGAADTVDGRVCEGAVASLILRGVKAEASRFTVSSVR